MSFFKENSCLLGTKDQWIRFSNDGAKQYFPSQTTSQVFVCLLLKISMTSLSLHSFQNTSFKQHRDPKEL